MLRCPSCQTESIASRWRLLASLWSPIVCPSCGCKCRPDLRAFWQPFWLTVIVLLAFFATKAYADTFQQPSVPVIFVLMILNVAMIASAVWLLVSVAKLPLKRG
jgi:hypothetical protein